MDESRQGRLVGRSEFHLLKKPVVLLKNETLQSIKVDAQVTDNGWEITVYNRIDERGKSLGKGQVFKMEEDDAPTG